MRKFLFLLPIAAFILWWQSQGGVLFPPLRAITESLVNSGVIGHVAASLWRAAAGAAIGISLGLLIGLLSGASRAVRAILRPPLAFFMPIPGIALAPLFILWLGFGWSTLVAVGALAAFFPVVVSVSEGVSSLDPSLMRASMTLGVPKWRVYVPAAMVHLLSGLKLAWARAWRTVIACEFVAAASTGLGFMIWDASEYLRMSTVYGGILLLMVVFMLSDWGLRAVEKRTVVKWGMVR